MNDLSFARWRCPTYGLVHWVTSRHNDRVFTACMEFVGMYRGRETFWPSYEAPTCLFCVCDEEPYDPRLQ